LDTAAVDSIIAATTSTLYAANHHATHKN